jgi:hypothetical protein
MDGEYLELVRHCGLPGTPGICFRPKNGIRFPATEVAVRVPESIVGARIELGMNIRVCDRHAFL